MTIMTVRTGYRVSETGILIFGKIKHIKLKTKYSIYFDRNQGSWHGEPSEMAAAALV